MPFTLILKTPVHIGRYFLITAKWSNPHSFTQALFSNSAVQTANLMDTPPFINNLQRIHVGRANSYELIGSRMFKWWVAGIMTVCSHNTYHASVFNLLAPELFFFLI